MNRILFAALLLFSVGVFAQKPIRIEEVPRTMVKEIQPSFCVEIPQTNLKEAEKNWLKYLATGAKGKAVIVNGDHLQTGKINKNIAVNPFDVYSKLRETSDGVYLTVWLPENNAVFNLKEPNNGVNMAVGKYIRDFAVQEYRRVVQKELKAEQTKQKNMEKDLAKLVKAEEKSIKKVNKNKRSTERANEAIATNNRDIRNSSYKIDDQKERVEDNAADANAAKGAKKTLAEMESEKKDLQKKNETQGKNIDNRNQENREEERNMTTSNQQQSSKTNAIEKQKLIVHEVQVKLDNIK